MALHNSDLHHMVKWRGRVEPAPCPLSDLVVGRPVRQRVVHCRNVPCDRREILSQLRRMGGLDVQKAQGPQIGVIHASQRETRQPAAANLIGMNVVGKQRLHIRVTENMCRCAAPSCPG